MNTCERERKHMQPAAAVLVGGLPGNAASHGDEVTRVRELERMGGEDEGIVRRNDVSSGGVRPPDRLPQNKGCLATLK